jgi:hypothetical protein
VCSRAIPAATCSAPRSTNRDTTSGRRSQRATAPSIWPELHCPSGFPVAVHVSWPAMSLPPASATGPSVSPAGVTSSAGGSVKPVRSVFGRGGRDDRGQCQRPAIQWVGAELRPVRKDSRAPRFRARTWDGGDGAPLLKHVGRPLLEPPRLGAEATGTPGRRPTRSATASSRWRIESNRVSARGRR